MKSNQSKSTEFFLLRLIHVISRVFLPNTFFNFSVSSLFTFVCLQLLGVNVTRSAMLAHARTLTTACNYTEGEIMVCVLDFKREVGLWHSMLASVFNGMHVIFIPYALMKVNPASWMQMVTKHRATVAVCKSRDLHWGLLATKDHRELNLSSLRMLTVADGANPWSLSSCDQFLSVFQVSFFWHRFFLDICTIFFIF